MGLALLIPDILAIVVSFITVGLTLPVDSGCSSDREWLEWRVRFVAYSLQGSCRMSCR